MKALQRLIIPCVGALSLLASGCGDNDTCGEGFAQQDGMCVPATQCGPGTTADSTGECVPDGSVVCDQGTIFDTESGTCKIDPDQCAAGTVFLEGECIPEDEALEGMADHVEGPEPNDGAGGVAGAFDAPAEGESTSIFGCVEPSGDADGDGNLDGDFDAWLIQASGPTVLELTADGIRGLSAGFVLVNNDPANSPALDAYQRFGVNLSGDTSKRQVFLPAAGSYNLLMTDSRTLFLDSAGAEDACYFTTIETVPLPAATPFAAPAQPVMHKSDVVVFNYNAVVEAEILATFINSASAQMDPSFVMMRNGVLSRAGDGNGSLASAGNLQTAGDELLFVYDPTFNYALVPQAAQFDSNQLAVAALPTDGTTLTRDNRSDPDIPLFATADYLYFDVGAAGEVLHFDLTNDIAVGMNILRADAFTPTGALDLVGAIGEVTAFEDEFVRFLAEGRYYVQTFDPLAENEPAPGGTYAVTSTLTALTPSAITYDAALANQELPAQGSGFHTSDLNNPTWSQFNVTGTDLGANVNLTVFDAAGEGILNQGYNPILGNQIPSDGTAAVGAILRDLDFDVFIQVEPAQAIAVDPATYEVFVGDQPFTELMPLTEADPRSIDDGATVAGVPLRVLVPTTTGDRITALLTDTAADGVLNEINRGEFILQQADNGGAGADETLASLGQQAPEDFLAFTILTDVDSTVDLNLTAVSPIPYDVAAGNLVFDTVCDEATAVELFADADETLEPSPFGPGRSLPFAFSQFGDPVTTYRVSSNGWLAFDDFGGFSADFSADPIPTAGGPNGFFAPLWGDASPATACVFEEATQMTVEWNGGLFGVTNETLQFQLVLHDDGVVDFIYGPNHTVQGSEPVFGSAVGAENIDGLFGHQIFFNEDGIDPDDSYVLTPQ